MQTHVFNKLWRKYLFNIFLTSGVTEPLTSLVNLRGTGRRYSNHRRPSHSVVSSLLFHLEFNLYNVFLSTPKIFLRQSLGSGKCPTDPRGGGKGCSNLLSEPVHWKPRVQMQRVTYTYVMLEQRLNKVFFVKIDSKHLFSQFKQCKTTQNMQSHT
jgi:hypothetical protein